MADPTTTEQVAQHVTQKVKESGVTVTWLCEATGIPRTTMHRRLSGLAAFDINELERIAKALRVPTAALVEPITEQAAS